MEALSTIKKNAILNLLAIVWSAFSMGYISAVTFWPVPEQSIRIVDTILGFILGTVVATVLNYYFGSSKSSADKNEIIKQQQQ